MAERRGGLVILSGLPGTGKSTLSRGLARRSGALWLRADAIEQEMRESHMVCEDLADGGYAAMRAVARGALRQGYDVIADSVNPLPVTRLPWEDLGRRAAGWWLAVELTCSDPAAHRHRIETRAPEVPGLAATTWQAVGRRPYAPYEGAHLRLDTAGLPPERVVTDLLRAMQTRGSIGRAC